MSVEFWIGLFVGVALLFVPYIVKGMPWYIAFAGFTLCVTVAVWLGLPDAFRPPAIACALYTVALVAGVLGAGYHWTREMPSSSQPAHSQPQPNGLRDHFFSDFDAKPNGSVATLIRGYSDVPLSNDTDLRLDWFVATDFGGRSRFMGYYIPESPVPVFGTAAFIAENYKSQIDAFTTEIRTGQSDTAINSSRIPFSGRIFIYHEQDINEAQMAELVRLFKKHKLAPEFRSASYPLRVFDAEENSRLRAKATSK